MDSSSLRRGFLLFGCMAYDINLYISLLLLLSKTTTAPILDFDLASRSPTLFPFDKTPRPRGRPKLPYSPFPDLNHPTI